MSLIFFRGVIVIRHIDVSEISKVVAELCIEANCHLGIDVRSRLEDCAKGESSDIGREIIGQLLENAAIASHEEIPMCQDTGFAVVFIEIGQDVHFTGGDLVSAVNAGVQDGYSRGYLRKSMVNDPLHRTNTGDNTPAMIHSRIVPGEQVRITVAPKGGGSENMSALKMLKPAEGVEGVKRFVRETVKNAGPNPCPPTVIGVGVGGTMEIAAYLAKYALTRPLGDKSTDADSAKLEEELLSAINTLGIGPQGLGGTTTAMAVHVEKYPTHIACLPVAVNISCHAYRHKTAVI